MENVLIVDDEQGFLLSLKDGLASYSDQFRIQTASNGEEAVKILESRKIDLVLTDLKMPKVDGFVLLSHINRVFPEMPVIVMTAFGNQAIEEKLREIGACGYLEKPLDIKTLAREIEKALAADHEGAQGRVTLSMFLHLVKMQKKTCTVGIKAADRTGLFFLINGELMDAETGGMNGEAAAYEMLGWKNVQIEISGVCRRKDRVISTSLDTILMEALDGRKDVVERSDSENPDDFSDQREDDVDWVSSEDEVRDSSEQGSGEKASETALKLNAELVEKSLNDLSDVEGFAGACVFAPDGEALAILEAEREIRISKMGTFAGDILKWAKKAALKMGARDSGQLVHLECEQTHILIKCLTQGSGRAAAGHDSACIPLVMVLISDSSLGMGKIMVHKVAADMALNLSQ